MSTSDDQDRESLLPEFSEEDLHPVEEGATPSPTEAFGEEITSPSEPPAEAPFSTSEGVVSPTEEPLQAGIPEGLGALETAPAALSEIPPETPSERTETKPTRRSRKKAKEKEAHEREPWFKRLQKTSPYVVLLGLSVLALLIAVLCLVKELADYNFDIKAQEAKQRAAMAPAVQSGPANTSAAA